MISVEIDQSSMDEIKELQRRHRKATEALQAEPNSALTRMLAGMSIRIADAWIDEAPELTGSLKAATREQVFEGNAKVYTDPSIENPIFGGFPAHYGMFVHNRNNWIERVYQADVPRILSDEITEFWGALDRIYAQ